MRRMKINKNCWAIHLSSNATEEHGLTRLKYLNLNQA